MKKKILVLSLIGFILFMFGCENQPMIPESAPMNSPSSLAKKVEGSFMANADDWFVRSQPEPGPHTFAQFNYEDDDVTLLPNGHVLLKNRELSSPLRQDETESCNFLFDNDYALKLVISASLNSDLVGPAHGTISITGTWNEELTGTFAGHFSGFFSDERGNSLFEGNFNAKGTDGDFIGMQIKGTMLEIYAQEGGPDFIMEGNIKSH